MSRLIPLAGLSSYLVTADDGTLFHCQPHHVRREDNGHGDQPSEIRWIFIDTSHVRYVGPVYEGHLAPRALQRMLSEWWRGRRASQSGRASREASQF